MSDVPRRQEAELRAKLIRMLSRATPRPMMSFRKRVKKNIQRPNKAATISIRQATHTMMDATNHCRVGMLRALARLGMSTGCNRIRMQQICTSSHPLPGMTNTRINRTTIRTIMVRTTTMIQNRAGGVLLCLSLRYSAWRCSALAVFTAPSSQIRSCRRCRRSSRRKAAQARSYGAFPLKRMPIALVRVNGWRYGKVGRRMCRRRRALHHNQGLPPRSLAIWCRLPGSARRRYCRRLWRSPRLRRGAASLRPRLLLQSRAPIKLPLPPRHHSRGLRRRRWDRKRSARS